MKRDEARLDERAPNTALINRLETMRDFLAGARDLDGTWFGDDPAPGVRKARFWWRKPMRRDIDAAIAALSGQQPAEGAPPIPMLLFCPQCHVKHVDEPDERTPDWTNPPHRSHLCHNCGCIWRPADVPTEGVAAIATTGKADTIDLNAAPSLTTPPPVPDRQDVEAREIVDRAYRDCGYNSNGIKQAHYGISDKVAMLAVQRALQSRPGYAEGVRAAAAAVASIATERSQRLEDAIRSIKDRPKRRNQADREAINWLLNAERAILALLDPPLTEDQANEG